MRKSKVRKLKVKQHTPAERISMRKFKRKQGPAAQRRRERRSGLQPKTEVSNG